MIYGIQKLSLVDYPHHPSFVIFLGGCNFRCPFCHNKGIVLKSESVIDVDEVLEQIKLRIGFIDSVVVTGGEPTIYGEKLLDLLRQLKSLGILVKLDSNGTSPQLLEQIFSEKLIDYIAMDLKNCYDRYKETVGGKVKLDDIKKSIELIENAGIPYEFRMTVNKKMHNEDAINTAKSYLKQKEKLILQGYKYGENQLVDEDFGEFSENELKTLKETCDTLARV